MSASSFITTAYATAKTNIYYSQGSRDAKNDDFTRIFSGQEICLMTIIWYRQSRLFLAYVAGLNDLET